MDVVDLSDKDPDYTMDGDQKNGEVGSGCNSSGSNVLHRESEDETDMLLLMEVWDGSPEAAEPSSSSPGESVASSVDGRHACETQPSDVIGTCQTVDGSSSTLSDLQRDKDGVSKVKGSYTEGSEKSSKHVSQNFSTKGGGYKDSSCKSGTLEMIIDLTEEEEKLSAPDNETQRLVCGARGKNDHQESNKSKEHVHVAKKRSMKTRKLEDTSLHKSGALDIIDLTEEEEELEEKDKPLVSGYTAQRDMHETTRDKNHDSSTSSEVFRSSVEQCDLEQAGPCMIDLTGYDATRDLDEEVAVILDKSLDPSMQNPTSSSCRTGYTVTISTSQPRITKQDSSFHAITEDPDTRSAADAVTSSGSFDDASSRDTDAFVRTLLCREPGFDSSSSSRCSSPEWEELTALNEGGTVSFKETTPCSTEPSSYTPAIEELDLGLNNYPTRVNPSASPYINPDKDLVKANDTQSENNNMERSASPRSLSGESTSKEKDEKKSGLQALLSLRIRDIISPISVSDSDETESTDKQNFPDNSPTVPCIVVDVDTGKANSTQEEDNNQEKMATPGPQPSEETMDNIAKNGKTSGMGTLLSFEIANKDAKETESTDKQNMAVQITVPGKCSYNSPTLPCSDPEEDKVNRTQVSEEDNQEKMASPRSGPSEELIHTKSRIQALLSLRMENTGVLDSKQDTESPEQQDCSGTAAPKDSKNEECRHQSLEQEVALVLANICDIINSTLGEEGSLVRLDDTSQKHKETQSGLEVQNHKVETVEQQPLKTEVALVRLDGTPQKHEETESGLEVQHHKDETVEQQPLEQEVALVLTSICDRANRLPVEEGSSMRPDKKNEETESDLDIQHHKDETVEQQENIVGRHNLLSHVATEIDNSTGVDIMELYEDGTVAFEAQSPGKESSTIVNITLSPVQPRSPNKPPCSSQSKALCKTSSDVFEVESTEDNRVDKQCAPTSCSETTPSKDRGNGGQNKDTEEVEKMDQGHDERVELQEQAVTHVSSGNENSKGEIESQKPSKLLQDDKRKADEANKEESNNASCSQTLGMELQSENPIDSCKEPGEKDSQEVRCTSDSSPKVQKIKDNTKEPSQISSCNSSEERTEAESTGTVSVQSPPELNKKKQDAVPLKKNVETPTIQKIIEDPSEIASSNSSEEQMEAETTGTVNGQSQSPLEQNQKKQEAVLLKENVENPVEEKQVDSIDSSSTIQMIIEAPEDFAKTASHNTFEEQMESEPTGTVSVQSPPEQHQKKQDTVPLMENVETAFEEEQDNSDSSPTIQTITEDSSKIASSEERMEAESTGTVSVQSPPEQHQKKQDAVPLKENEEEQDNSESSPTIQTIIEDSSKTASNNSSVESMAAESTETVSGQGQSPPEQNQKKQDTVPLKESVENAVEEKQVDGSNSSPTIQMITQDPEDFAKTASLNTLEEQIEAETTVPLKENVKTTVEEEQDNSDPSPTIQMIIENPSKIASNNSSVESMAAESTETVGSQGHSPPEQHQKQQDAVPLKENVETAVEVEQVDNSDSTPIIQTVIEDPQDLAKTASHNIFEEQMEAESTGQVSGQGHSPIEQNQKENVETAVEVEEVDNNDSSPTIQTIKEDPEDFAETASHNKLFLEEQMEAKPTGTVSGQSPPELNQKKKDAVPLKENVETAFEEEQDNSESSPTIQMIIDDSSKVASNNSSEETMAAESTATVGSQGQSPPEQDQKKHEAMPSKENVENAGEKKQVDGSDSTPTVQTIIEDPEHFAKTLSHNSSEEQMGAETTETVSGQSQSHLEQNQEKRDAVPSKETVETVTAVVEEDLQIDNSGSSTLNSPLCKDIDFSQLDDLSPNSSIGDAILDFVQQANIQGVLGEEDKNTERDPSQCVKENQVQQLPVEFESCDAQSDANCGEKQKLQDSTSDNCGLNELMDEISQLCETRDCTLLQETEEQGSKEQHMHTGARHCPVVSQTFDTEEKEESSEKSGTQGLDGFVRRADNINQNTCVESSGEGQRSLDGRRGDVHGATSNRKENSSVTMATSRGSTMGQVSLWELMDHQGPFIIYPSQGGGGEGVMSAVRNQSTQPAPASTTTDSPTVTQGMSGVGNAVYSALSAVNADSTGGQQDEDEPTTMLDLDTHTVTTSGGMVLRSGHATNADQFVAPRATVNENPSAQQTEIENTTQTGNTSEGSKDGEGETNEDCPSELDLQVGVMTRARARRLQQLLFLEEAASETATSTVSAPVPMTYSTDGHQAMQTGEREAIEPAVPPGGMDAVAMAMMCSGLEDDALEDVASGREAAPQGLYLMTREDLVEGSAAGQIIHCIPGANVTQTINRAHPDLLPTVITSMSSLAGHHVTSLTIQEQEFLFLEEISYKVYNHTVSYVLSRCNLLQISRIRCKGQYLEFLRPYCHFIDRRSNHCYLIRTEDAELLHRSFLRLKKKEKTQKTGKKKKGSVLPRCAQCGHEEQLRRRGRKRQAEATVSVNPEEHQADRLQEDAAAADILQSDLGPDNLFPRGRMASNSWNPTLIGFRTDAACQTQDCSTETGGQGLEKECEEPPRKRHCSSVVATACQTTEESEQLETEEKCSLMEQHSRGLAASEESSSSSAEGPRSSSRRRHESRSSVVTSTQSINLLAESSADPDEQMTTFYITTKVVGTRLQKVNISVRNDKGEELATTEQSRDSEGEQVSSEDQGYSETIEETPVSPVEGLGSGQELEYSHEVGKAEEVTHSGISEFCLEEEQTEGCTTSSDSGVSTKTLDSIEKCNSSLEQDVSQLALCMEQSDQGIAEGCTASHDSGVSTKTMDCLSIEKHRSSPVSDVMISPSVPSMKQAEAEAMIEGCTADCGGATKTMASNSSLESDASPSPVPCMHQDEEASRRAGEVLESDVCKKRHDASTGDLEKDDIEDVLSIMQESGITVADKRKEVLYNTKEEAAQDMCLKLVMEDSNDVEETEEGLGEVMSIMYESGIDLAASSEMAFMNGEDTLKENFLCANKSVTEQSTSEIDMEDVTSIMEDSGISMAEDVMAESCTYHKADTRGTTEAESNRDVATLDQNKNKVVPSEKNLAKIDKTIEGYLEKEQNVEEELMKTAACQDDTWKCPNQNHETVAVEDQSAEILYTHQNGPKRIGHLVVFDTEAMPSLSPIQAIVDRKLSYSDTKASCHEPSSSKGSEALDQAVEESNQTMECSPRSLKPTLHSQRDKDAKLHSESSGPSSITPVRIPTSSSPQPCIPSENVMSKRSKSGLMPNCSVCLWDCSPLLVSHTSKGGAFTGWGYLYPHWCSSLRDDPCVYCPVCNAFYNVSAYLGHFHEKQGLVVHRGSYGLQMESRQATGAQKRQWNDFAKRHPAAIKGCATPQKRLLTATQRNVGKCRRKIAVRFTKVKGGKWTVSSSSKGCTEKDVSEDKASGTEQQHDNFAENTAALAAEQRPASCRTNQSASENTAAIVQEQQTASYRRSKYTAESTAAVAEEQQTASCSTNKNAAEDNTADVEEQETASCSTSKHSATEDTAAVAESLQTASCSRRESVAADTQAASVDANHANGLPGPISTSEESGPSEGSSSFSSAVPKGKPRGKRSGGHPGGGQNAKIAKTSSDNGKNSPVLDGKPRGKRTGGRPGGNKTLPIREGKSKTEDKKFRQ
ncbi:PREDICTED: uncharacterized protein LOC109471395 [Branchiostoma belcheri]|uniref:Uncharacterized protein LOC109471395 n=1 Tax=Branchiostoma belcheri TaxID=7741 RepID=A0A6P4Z584_BRABE|nr:PREDICTED: uncharacterized protein LOC109471395 [Branchiostoma belcheri]